MRPILRAYWRLIDEGRSAVSEVPADRWNADEFYDPTGETPGKMSVRWAAFIDNPDQFDPQFFGITPREAARMDPQQRLLLEVAWEAMENAGRPAEELAGTPNRRVRRHRRHRLLEGLSCRTTTIIEQIDAHLGTGNALSIAANRLSYIFDFHGPSAAVDTACSSSSLAIHFAVESLRRGESDAALAGGVNMILTPETTIAFSKARMLSPEGVCRPFDCAGQRLRARRRLRAGAAEAARRCRARRRQHSGRAARHERQPGRPHVGHQRPEQPVANGVHSRRA